jgi:hypothetical protein
MKKKIKQLIGRLDSYRLKNFGRTQRAVYIVTMLIIGIAEGVAFIDSGLPKALSFIIAFISSIIAANIALAAV